MDVLLKNIILTTIALNVDKVLKEFQLKQCFINNISGNNNILGSLIYFKNWC